MQNVATDAREGGPAVDPGGGDAVDAKAGGEPRGRYLGFLALAALGVVYGDIGTSPLYALRESFHYYGLTPTPGNVLGVLSRRSARRDGLLVWPRWRWCRTRARRS